jgi:hypothetical protein
MPISKEMGLFATVAPMLGYNIGKHVGKYVGPTSQSIDNLKKEELVTVLDSAIDDVSRRMAVRMYRGQ